MATLPTYSDFKEKLKNFRLQKVDTIKEFYQIVETQKSLSGIYRGVSSSAYKIFTSLQRQIILRDLQRKFNLYNYIETVRNNKLLNKYFETFKIVPSKLSIFSYLQNYSAPTPFLDFTTNFYKALYFAIENFDLGKHKDLNSISDYFTIFFINENDLELVEIPEVIMGLKKVKKFEIEALSFYEDYSEEYMIKNIDNLLSIKTCKVFLINHVEDFIDIYNTYNNIRIIAQEGLFIHNGYLDIPMEVALKEFFKEATQYVVSPWDEIDTEQSRIIDEQYRLDLERNRKYQKRLEENIIHSFEIKKTLIPEISKSLFLNKGDIYPNSEEICWQLFEDSLSK